MGTSLIAKLWALTNVRIAWKSGGRFCSVGSGLYWHNKSRQPGIQPVQAETDRAGARAVGPVDLSRIAAVHESCGAYRERSGPPEARSRASQGSSSFIIHDQSMLPAPFARLAPLRALVSLLGAARGHCGAARRFVAGTGAASKKERREQSSRRRKGRGHRPLQPYPEGVAIP